MPVKQENTVPVRVSGPQLSRAISPCPTQIQSGKYQVNSVSPDIFDDTYVIPWVDLYCGAGGMEFGSVRKQGKFTLVCVLAIDNDERVCATHRLSHPEVPVVQQTLTTWAQIQTTIEAHLPMKYWDKLWIHAPIT